jgi:hypothetical protein
VTNCRDVEIENIFGLIKCKILPPKKLLFPVLPCRTDKLTFPLCQTCVEKALRGTWTSIEVQRAIQHGYVILEVYEIYHYDNKQKIFDTYVDTFMKLKQESSGIPKHCFVKEGNVVDEKLNMYIDDYLQHENIQLEANKICHNPGQRTVMKALLNSYGVN